MFSLRNLARCALLSMFVSALVSSAREVAPGIVNFFQGQVALDGKTLAGDDARTAVVGPGREIETERGQAEVLLTPGVFLRIGESSAVKMEAVSEKGVRLELVRGEALVEVDQVARNRRLDVIVKGADAHLDHSGVYRFNVSEPAIAVYFGRVRVEDDRRGITLGPGQELLLNGTNALKPRKFARAGSDAVYDWSRQRAGYASQVSEWTGESLLGLDGQAKYSDGWYWNPWFKSWAFVPESGHVLSPFGYGFYAPQAPHYLPPVFADFQK
jgi:hypothetical protein